MSLIKCHECGSDVSTEAKACPGCGAPVVRRYRPSRAFVIMMALAAVIAIVSVASDRGGYPGAASTSATGCTTGDLQCAGRKLIAKADSRCADGIERLAKFHARWVDGAFESKFSRFRWRNEAAGEVTLIGDKVEFQNGFGAYARMTYECDMAAGGETVLAVRAYEGRLPQ